MADSIFTNRVKKPRGPGKKFAKGDPRINRKGRPKSPAPKNLRELKSLIDEILSEPAPKKTQRNKLQNAIDMLLKSGSGAQYVIDKRYGKTPTTVDVTMATIFTQINLEVLPIELLDRISRGDASVVADLIGNKDVLQIEEGEIMEDSNSDEENKDG